MSIVMNKKEAIEFIKTRWPKFLEEQGLSNDWNSAIYRIKYLDVLTKYEKKVRSEIKNTLYQLDEEKIKRSIDLNHKVKLLKEKKNKGMRGALGGRSLRRRRGDEGGEIGRAHV